MTASRGKGGMAAVSEIQAIIDYLVQERQTLRDRGGGKEALDANREALVYWQREIGQVAARLALAGAA
jgi:hypothetical protein